MSAISRLTVAPSSVAFRLSAAEEGIGPILAAAAALTDRAYVVLSGRPTGRLCLRLRPKRKGTKKGLERLAMAFEAELSQRKAAFGAKGEVVFLG